MRQHQPTSDNMATAFTDISRDTPMKDNEKQFKRRSGLTGRRLLPLADVFSQGAPRVVSSNNATYKVKKITHKRELMEAVRKASTPIMLPGREAGSTRTLQEGTGSTASLDIDSSQRDIESLEDGVHHNARKFNELKLMVDRRQRELHGLLDELRVLQRENETLNKIQNKDTPVSKKNNQIKQDIAQCTANMEEQMHSRRQLEHMIRRLQTTQQRVDAQLTGMATAVDSSEREVEEVRLLCRQLEVGKSHAVQFLQDVQLQLHIERKARARELGDHEVRARNSQRMEMWRLQRVKERDEMVAELRGDLSVKEESQMLKNVENRERTTEALHAANVVKGQKSANFEALLAEMKLTTGAASLREVVEKIGAQAATSVSLEKEKLQAEERFIAIRQKKEVMEKELNELKASGSGSIELNREVYNSLEDEIRQAKATLKVNKSAFDHLDGVMSAIRQGSFGLARRLQVFDDILEADHSSALEGTPNLIEHGRMVSTSSMLSLMSGEHAAYLVMAELKLTKILEIVGQPTPSVNSFGGYDDASADGGGVDVNTRGIHLEENTHPDGPEDGNTMWSPIANSDPHLHENNIRVRPATRGLPSLSVLAAQVGITLPDSDEEPDSARSEVFVDRLNVDEETSGLVPSRDILKMSSLRHYTEVMRKKELKNRQKVATEKGVSDEEVMAKLRKRNQVEEDTRLATSPTRHGAHLFLAKAAFGTKDAMAGSTSVKTSHPLAFVTQMQFSDL